MYGVTGNGTTDDRAGIILALADAIALRRGLFFPAGRYRISKYIDVAHARGLRIYGDGGATIIYASDDTNVVSDSVANSNAKARSAFLLRYCTDTTFYNLSLEGGQATDILTVNVGYGVYATRCHNTQVIRWRQRWGYSPYGQDATTGTTGTGDSLAVSGSTVTIVDAAAAFQAGHQWRNITIAGATNPTNNGTFPLTGYTSATTLTFTNVDAVAETSSFTWTIDDGDYGTVIDGLNTYGCRGSMHGGSNVKIVNCVDELPDTGDRTGLGDTLTISGTTVTLRDQTSRIDKTMVGKYIVIAGATSSANNGTFLITGVTAASGLNPCQVTWANASGVSEIFPGSWYIMNGEKAGIGAGASGITNVGGTTFRLKASAASFTANDVNKNIRISNATSVANNGIYQITACHSSTEVDYVNAAGVAEAFAKTWAVDSYDRASTGTGSTHWIYIFAGRSDYYIAGNTVKNRRTTAVKVSGSSIPISSILTTGNTFIECGNCAVWGADDSQEHNNLAFTDNTVVDCGIGHPGWSDGDAFQLLGSRGVRIAGNRFHYTRNAIGSVDGNGISANSTISASRYVPGRSQPIEQLVIDNNRFSADPNNTTVAGLVTSCITVTHVGIASFYATAGTLTGPATVNGLANQMTLTDNAATFPVSIVGHTIELVNCTHSANNINNVTITSVNSTGTAITFTNVSGVAEVVGTYRIWPGKWVDNNGNVPAYDGGHCVISNNRFDGVAAQNIICTSNVGPDVFGNVGSSGAYQFLGDVSPRFVHNRQTIQSTASPITRYGLGTSWPYDFGNTATNAHALGASVATKNMGISVDGSTVADYPLLGCRGRAKPSNAQQEVVLAYGSLHVDGDTVSVNGTTFTYKASSPGANQFNTCAGLITLIDAISGVDAADYGSMFAARTVTMQHIRIRMTAQSASDDGTLHVQTHSLNPTALVPLPNVTSATDTVQGRGAGSAGPVADKTVVWSHNVGYDSTVVLTADNTTARTLLTAGGYVPVRASGDAGCCQIIQHNDSSDGAGTDLGSEFRWVVIG